MLFLNFLLDMLFRDAHFFINKNAIAEHLDLQKLILYNNFDIHVDFTTEFITESTPVITNELYTIQSSTYTKFSIRTHLQNL